jgi:toxin ParE1/3/4
LAGGLFQTKNVNDGFRDNMARYEIAPAAARDIEAVLRWTYHEFGERAMERYKALITQAIREVANDPDLPGSTRRSEITAGARTYHLVHSRNHVSAGEGRVRRPRHFLLYRTRPDTTVEIGRVLHDSVDLPRHLPEEYRTSSG